MGKLISMLGAFVLALAFVPIQALAAGDGTEEVLANAAPTGLLLAFFLVLSFGTLITMIFLCIRDNG